uniref:tRNA dihydrouridine(16) synthase DusC n=1 Tax=Ningiella ruwaisensis TaxID=2364274 RepID=UPI00109F1EE8|nr:tRNA dihydrouridine(16) synthase DusC [Ningiella ruwaisensis]
MKIFLAPMEGVVDHLMRDMLTQLGGFDLCVTEFLRVVEQLHSDKMFYKICPELANGCKTPSGVPVRIQLLGQHPQWLAENAIKAIDLGSHGVDLNFGCPAKTVNKSKGGAVLLKEPDTLYKIVKAVREAVPSEHVVSAKIRLGFDDKSLALENADAIEKAGASLLTVHARTKVEGYKPPAYWDWIAKIKQQVSIPIIANGEIWHADDALKCQMQSQVQDIMLGRGALSLPNLAATIKFSDAPMQWPQVKELLIRYSGYEIFGDKGRYYPNRIKQWLGYLQREYSEAHELFSQVRTLKDSNSIVSVLRQD